MTAMDNNNWRPAQGGPEPTIDTRDWRGQLQNESRQRIVNKIMDTLKRHLPFSGQGGLLELKKIAISFEEKIYTAATSQSDYLRKISLKMLTMESKSQNTMANALPSNSASNSQNPTDKIITEKLSYDFRAKGKWQKSSFKQEHDLEKRRAEAARIREIPRQDPSTNLEFLEPVTAKVISFGS